MLARPSVADLYPREAAIDRVIAYPALKGLGARREFAGACAHSDSTARSCCRTPSMPALIAGWQASRAIGYGRDGRGTADARDPGARARRNSAPRALLLSGTAAPRRTDRAVSGERRDSPGWHRRGARGRCSAPQRAWMAGPVIGISPGAAYGDAKRWLPERFAESGRQVAGTIGGIGAGVRIGGGTRAVRDRGRGLCGARESTPEISQAKPRLREFIDLAAACRIFLTNDSGAMHVASALGVPTVAVFGATDDTTTGPTGPLARVVREHAECSPCLLRECPIDHRCMTRVTAAHVTGAASILLEQSIKKRFVVQEYERLRKSDLDAEARSRGENKGKNERGDSGGCSEPSAGARWVSGGEMDTRTKIVSRRRRRAAARWSAGRSMWCWRRTLANWRRFARATLNGPSGGGVAARGFVAAATRARGTGGGVAHGRLRCDCR